MMNGLIGTINCVWRLYKMHQQAMGFVKGIGTGLAVGMALVAVGSRMMRDNRSFRRRANRTMRTVGELLDNVQEIFH